MSNDALINRILEGMAVLCVYLYLLGFACIPMTPWYKTLAILVAFIWLLAIWKDVIAIQNGWDDDVN